MRFILLEIRHLGLQFEHIFYQFGFIFSKLLPFEVKPSKLSGIKACVRMNQGCVRTLKDAYLGQFFKQWNFIFKDPKTSFFDVGQPLDPWDRSKTTKKL